MAAVDYFRARYEALVIGITAFSVLIMGGVALPVLVFVPQRFSSLTVLFLLAVVLVTYGLSPRGFSLSPDGLRIHRPFGAHVLPFARIRSARRAQPGELGGLRTFGSGGMFGFFGWFWSRKMGHYRAYVTHRQDMVLVEAERTYLLSPERPDDFLRSLSNWLPPQC